MKKEPEPVKAESSKDFSKEEYATSQNNNYTHNNNIESAKDNSKNYEMKGISERLSERHNYNNMNKK